MKRLNPETLQAFWSSSTKRLNAGAPEALHGANGVELVSKVGRAPSFVKTAKEPACRRDRTPKPANKAEAEWAGILRRRYPSATVTPHGMTLRFPDGDTYTPDVLMAFDRGNFAVILYEVKAGYRGPGWEQGMERFKRAKAAFPWVVLRLAEKRGGVWYVDGKQLGERE